MRPEPSSYMVVVAVATVMSAILVPVFIRLSARLGAVALPDARRSHKSPTPSLGGGAMYFAFVAAFLFAWFSGRFPAVFSNSSEPWAIFAGATVAYVIGLFDDIRDLSPPAKLAGLSLAGAALALGGVGIIWFRVPFLEVFILPYDLAFVVTVVWVLGMANAVNFIDGLDGLAAGIVAIGAAAFLLYGLQLADAGLLLAGNIGPLVAAIVAGVCLGFLPWNIHPARVFMGDGGSLFLGVMMAASTMAVGGRTPDPYSGQTFFFYAPLVIPLVILGVPVFDTAFAIVRRAKSGRSLASADRGHLHHRLMRLGHGHRRTVTLLWAWTLVLSLFVLYPVYNDGRGDAVVPVGVAAFALALFTLFHPILRNGSDSGYGGDGAGPVDPVATAVDPVAGATAAGTAAPVAGATAAGTAAPVAGTTDPADSAANSVGGDDLADEAGAAGVGGPSADRRRSGLSADRSPVCPWAPGGAIPVDDGASGIRPVDFACARFDRAPADGPATADHPRVGPGPTGAGVAVPESDRHRRRSDDESVTISR